jgi:8-oxo-dGTP pyrophosphatase MutT (NUDIX family)
MTDINTPDVNKTTTTKPPSSSFTFHPSLTPFAVHPPNYLQANPTLNALIISAVVVHKPFPDGQPRVLLIQRAATDYFPLLWECPGGCVDPDDATILDAVQRELFEETGLSLKRVAALLDDTVEFVWTDGRSRRITFLVEIQGAEVEVVLNPEEHADYVWAGVDEVQQGVCDTRAIDFSHDKTKGIILDAIRVVTGELTK